MTKKRAFTLIELLVVIAVIAVLMGILMPALRRVREQARMTGCTSNQRQWGITLFMYAEEHDGKLFDGVNSDGWWWILQLPDKMKDWETNKFWFCPTATKPIQNINNQQTGEFTIYHAWGVFGHQETGYYTPENGMSGSYGLNGFFINSRVNGGKGRPGEWKSLYKVKQAPNVPLMVDALRFDLWPNHNNAAAENEFNAWNGPGGNGMSRGCINRHQGFVCAAFADGSARKVGLKELWTLKWSTVFETNGKFTTAGGVTSDMWPDWLKNFPDY